MGSKVGHVAPGMGFIIIGLWHLFNNTKLRSQNPNSYTSSLWFPFPSLRYLEPLLIAAGSSTSVAMELFIGPRRHHPLDYDLTIPTTHLHNFEHASISLSILTYAVFAVVFDRSRAREARVLHGLLGAAAFFQELLLFHLHSTDHAGVEGQFHWLLQVIILLSFVTTVVGIWRPRSFLVAYVRSMSIMFQGVWFVVIGYALYTPALVNKGCFMDLEDGRLTVRCRDEVSLSRAKSLANLEFSWFCTGMMIFSMVFYLVVGRVYVKHDQYVTLETEDIIEDLEAPKKLGVKC